MRKRIYEIIELSHDNDVASKIYDVFMMITILVSIIPLASKQQTSFFSCIDNIAVSIFIIDYILRFSTADFKYDGSKFIAFVRYPFTPLAIIDFISILPSITLLNNGLRLFKIFRLFRSLRVLRIFKIVRYSNSITMIISIFKKQKEALLTVCGIAIAYILISALVILNVEPESFDTYFEAVYWATVSLTTVGYGDIYPVSTAGKIVTMLSSIFGIAIIALPASIITAGMMEELNRKGD